MSLSPVGAPAATAIRGNSNLTLEDFLRVLTTQLTYQDPLKPMDNQAFMAQIAQFTSLEQTQQLNASIQALVSHQASQQSIGLIGRNVGVSTASGPVTGSVTAIDLSGATPQLSIGTAGGTLTGISLSQITSVR